MFIQWSCFWSFKEHTFQGLPSKYSTYHKKIVRKSLNYIQCLNIVPMEKTYFIKIFFELVIVMVKDEKYQN